MTKFTDDYFKKLEKYYGDLFNFSNDLFNQTGVIRHKVYTDEECYCLEYAVPGFTKDEVDVNILDDVLTLSANVKEDDETFWKKSFESKFRIPADSDVGSIFAKMENGLLIVKINKKMQKTNFQSISIS